MTLFRVLTERNTLPVITVLTLASAASCGLVLARMAWALKLGYSFLIWNLFLAWMPLVLALLVRHEYAARGRITFRLAGLATAWLLFFPNAPYIFTDLTHLRARLYGHYWVDLVLILCCALTGLVVGFVSLFLMQSVVRQKAGRVAGWVFVALVSIASGFGVYLGRFLRFNSWDVLIQPLALGRGIREWLSDSMSYPITIALPLLFGAFLLIAYLLLYALTWLSSLANRPLAESTTRALAYETGISP